MIWWRYARDKLAQLWIESPDPKGVTRAADDIDRLLVDDPALRIEERHEGLFRMTVEPLSVQFTIDEGNREVTVWTVRSING